MNNLEHYLNRNYTLVRDEIANYEQVISILPTIAGPTVIGIDGPSNSGKTSLAKAFGGVTIHADYFLVDRAKRDQIFKDIETGKLAIADYSTRAWDHDRLHSVIKQAMAIISGTKPAQLSIPAAYNRESGTNDATISLKLAPGDLLVVEGVGIHLYHHNLFDLSVRTDVRDTQVLWERLLSRELAKPQAKRLSRDYLKFRYDTVDALHTLYLREAAFDKADYILDTTDYAKMSVYQRN